MVFPPVPRPGTPKPAFTRGRDPHSDRTNQVLLKEKKSHQKGGEERVVWKEEGPAMLVEDEQGFLNTPSCLQVFFSPPANS